MQRATRLIGLPNLVIGLADDLGCYGREILTSNLDKPAENGLHDDVGALGVLGQG